MLSMVLRAAMQASAAGASSTRVRQLWYTASSPGAGGPKKTGKPSRSWVHR